jgi:hypothetical protein
MIRKLLVSVALATTLVAAHVPSAQAQGAPVTGACLIDIDIEFDEVVRLLTLARGFSYDLSGTCPFILAGGQGSHNTFGNGGADAIMWNCEITAADGDWTQWWNPSPPDGIQGDFSMAGSWGGWDIAITAPGTVAHGHLVLAPQSLGAPADCEGDGLWQMRMTGVMEFTING